MNPVIYFVLLAFAVTYSSGESSCSSKAPNLPTEWLDMRNGCANKVRRQIQMEVNASMTYLAMGEYFSRDTVNRPGFAKFFFDSAGEEREHAIKLIEYLLMRGRLNLPNDFNTLIKIQAPTQNIWSGVNALKDALKTEASVTKSIKDVIATCENDEDGHNDYHFVDYLTGEFLEEQYKGQRELAGKISTLEKMMASHGTLGEFLFDKKLL